VVHWLSQGYSHAYWQPDLVSWGPLLPRIEMRVYMRKGVESQMLPGVYGRQKDFRLLYETFLLWDLKKIIFNSLRLLWQQEQVRKHQYRREKNLWLIKLHGEQKALKNRLKENRYADIEGYLSDIISLELVKTHLESNK